MPLWVVWSEEHGAWWGRDENNLNYTRRLARARRYTETEAQAIAEDANRFLSPGEWHEVALPDPLDLVR